MKFIYSLLIFCSLNLLYSCQQPSEKIIESGVAKDLAIQRKANLKDVIYQLHFDIPTDSKTAINGRVTISFDLANVEEELVFDFKNPKENVLGVQSNGKKLDYRFENGHIIIPTSDLVVGKNSFDIQFIAGNQALNRNDDFLYTLFVPDKAATAFPCFDQPNIKASYQLSLDVPQNWSALANYPLVKKTDKANKTLFEFEPTLPISTYLFAFTVGQFTAITDTLDGIEMTLYHRETDEDKVKRNAPIVFDLHLKSIRWLEKYTGIAQPFKKFDFALIPAFQFGGMEHPGAIFYKDRSLFLEENATLNQKMGRNSLIAHETAHMWFGNLVTMDWFNDVWLKEVFANFMAAKMVHPNFPEVNHDLRFLHSHHPSAYNEDRSAGSHPIQQELENLNQASLLYGRIIYQKAPIVMKQLESIMGEENFQKGLQTYLEKFSFGNATWDDLIAILDERTDLDLKTWSQAWVKESGMPHIKATLQTENEKIVAYELEIQNQTSGGKTWQQNTRLFTSRKDNTASSPLQINADKTIVLPLKGEAVPDFILPNVSEQAYGFFELDEKSQQYLLQNVHTIQADLTKSAAWFSLWEAMLRGQIPPAQLLETIILGLPHESGILGLSSRLGYLRTTFWGFLDDKGQLAQAEKIENTIWDLFQKTNNPSLKKSLFDTYVNIARSEKAIQRLQKLWSKELVIKDFQLSENELTTLAYELAVRAVPNYKTILKEQLNSIDNPDRKAAMAFISPALSSDESERDAFFESLKQIENRQKEPWVGRALQYLHHPLRAQSAEKYIIPSLELVREIQQTGGIFFPKRWASTILNGHQSVAAAKLVHQFLEALPADYPIKLKNKILQSADLLERKAMIGS
jgi:aminopeptidase N